MRLDITNEVNPVLDTQFRQVELQVPMTASEAVNVEVCFQGPSNFTVKTDDEVVVALANRMFGVSFGSRASGRDEEDAQGEWAQTLMSRLLSILSLNASTQ